MLQGNAAFVESSDRTPCEGRWSPQTSGILQHMLDALQISHKTLYTELCAMGMSELPCQTLKLLCHGHKIRQLRRACLKSTNLSVHNQADLNTIAFQHNAEPLKSLGGKSPTELLLPPGSFDSQAYWATIINPVAFGT